MRRQKSQTQKSREQADQFPSLSFQADHFKLSTEARKDWAKNRELKVARIVQLFQNRADLSGDKTAEVMLTI